jgi:hypothetical protein
MAANRLPKLPSLLERKIYKTGQTRGADDDEIFQNRVSRSSTVLIPYACWELCKPMADHRAYDSGFIVLLSPSEYFAHPNMSAKLTADGLALGVNALVFYETREQWQRHNPERLKWRPARNRTNPLGGKYVARISATTAINDGGKIVRGFEMTSNKGAGIRVYEYASSTTVAMCRLQLEALYWLCGDAENVATTNGMTRNDATARKAAIMSQCAESGLVDTAKLTEVRVLNLAGKTVCPLCLEELSAGGFFSRMAQAEGRLVHDLTITQLNLFHITELRFGVLNHRPYNVGWGHHHCNVVVKDSGITETLSWMNCVLNRNIAAGHLPAENKPS